MIEVRRAVVSAVEPLELVPVGLVALDDQMFRLFSRPLGLSAPKTLSPHFKGAVAEDPQGVIQAAGQEARQARLGDDPASLRESPPHLIVGCPMQVVRKRGDALGVDAVFAAVFPEELSGADCLPARKSGED